MGRGLAKPLVELTLNRIWECVQNNQFYLESNRPENEMFIQEFKLDKDAQAKILLGININDYCESEESKRFPGKYIHIFAPKVKLLHSNGISENLSMYIKVEIRETKKGEIVAVISFHRLNFPIYHAFQ